VLVYRKNISSFSFFRRTLNINSLGNSSNCQAKRGEQTGRFNGNWGWRCLILAGPIGPKTTEAVQFLNHSMRRRLSGHVNLLQTDGGPEFKAEFKSKVTLFCSRHRIARPYRKNDQSYIESFNRTVRKECLGWQKYRLQDLPECQKMVELFLERYHYHQPHMGLRMRTPPRKEDECRISTEN